jgi:hypothetical protein
MWYLLVTLSVQQSTPLTKPAVLPACALERPTQSCLHWNALEGKTDLLYSRLQEKAIGEVPHGTWGVFQDSDKLNNLSDIN